MGLWISLCNDSHRMCQKDYYTRNTSFNSLYNIIKPHKIRQ